MVSSQTHSRTLIVSKGMLDDLSEFQKLVEVIGLQKIGVRLEIHRSGSIFLGRGRGHHDDGDVRTSPVFPQPSQDLEPVHSG